MSINILNLENKKKQLLSDVVYVDLPEVGDSVTASQQAATVESVKAAEDVNAPVSGEVIEVNAALEDTPEIVNDRPYAAWFFKVKPTATLDVELATLMNAEEYDDYVDNLDV